MNLTFKMTEKDVASLNEVLRISSAEFSELLVGGGKGSNHERIVLARKLIGLSGYEPHVCYDLKK